MWIQEIHNVEWDYWRKQWWNIYPYGYIEESGEPSIKVGSIRGLYHQIVSVHKICKFNTSRVTIDDTEHERNQWVSEKASPALPLIADSETSTVKLNLSGSSHYKWLPGAQLPEHHDRTSRIHRYYVHLSSFIFISACLVAHLHHKNTPHILLLPLKHIHESSTAADWPGRPSGPPGQKEESEAYIHQANDVNGQSGIA